MPYLIDGHNLIPKIPGLSLGETDDESRLIGMLLEFCRKRRKQVEVYFDNAPPGMPPGKNFGQVIAKYVRQGSTADEAIEKRLRQLKNQARNWMVVTSDLRVQAAAKSARSQVIPAEVFAQELLGTLQDAAGAINEKEAYPDEVEVKNWLDLFGNRS